MIRKICIYLGALMANCPSVYAQQQIESSKLRDVTITDAFWFHSQQRPSQIRDDWAPRNKDGHVLLRADPAESSRQFRSFYDAVDRQFLLRSHNQVEVKAHAEAGYWNDREVAVYFYLRIPARQMEKMRRKVAFSVVPRNGTKGFTWKVKPNVTITRSDERPSEADWKSLSNPFFQLHYSVKREDDAKRMHEHLEQTAKNLSDEFGSKRAQALLKTASIDVYLHPVATKQAREGLATLQTHTKDGTYYAKLHLLTPSAHRSGATTIVGEPMDDNYVFKTLVHEYSTIVLDRMTREKRKGWRFFSAPSWFVQGYEEYLGLMLSSQHSRRVTFEKYRDFHRSDRSRISAEFEVSRPYLDGAVILEFMHKTYGKEKVHAILLSEAPDFWTAVSEVLGQNRKQLYDAWSRWVREL